MNELVERVWDVIARAAYPEVHPDFTDAGWTGMARAAIAEMGKPFDLAVEALSGD